ncbi:MAG: helix-turn-helix domain-containing protein [Chloroflexi bacterium]|nr:helix-turn-helix domain-containing protein [Chloroflexota bacterium]
MEYAKQVPAADRTLNLLELLATAPEGLTAAEILTQQEISRSALFALLNTLKSRNYIIQSDQRGRYSLGPALWALIPDRQQGLRPLIEAFDTEMSLNPLPETVALAWVNNLETIILAQHASPQPVRAVYQPGERQPLGQTAAGHVLVAGESPGYIEKVAPELYGRLHQIHNQGISQTKTADLVEIAAPVTLDGVNPIAAIMLGIPRYRYDAARGQELVNELRQAAARVSYRLGAAVYQPYGWMPVGSIGPTRELNEAELNEFLQGAWGARLACIRQDGTPHVVPLWYEWDGRSLWLTASPGAFWKEYILTNPRVSLTIDEPWPPLRRVFVSSVATIMPEDQIPGGLAALRQRLAARYLGDEAAHLPELQETAGWSAVRIWPDKISGRQGLGER